MRYILVKIEFNRKDVKEDKYFKGYPGKGSGKGTKPTWTSDSAQAAQYDPEDARRVRLRLAWQSQVVDLVPMLATEESEHFVKLLTDKPVLKDIGSARVVKMGETEFQRRLRKFGGTNEEHT